MDDEGYIYIVDRLKDMIVSGGENVDSTEVENAIAKHPAVATCAVTGVPNDHWRERVHAVAVLKPGARQRTGGPRPCQGSDRGVQGTAQRRVRRRAAGLRNRQGFSNANSVKVLGRRRPQVH
jgi:acyl-CoA synthetase (AMP-forming)/AMP-acid ligase II